VTLGSLSEYSQFLKKLTRRVGDFLIKGNHNRKTVQYKGVVDLVTQYDTQSQTFIVREIERRYPEHGILSEENVAKNTKSGMKWIVDPLDGTTNFAHGLPIWSVSIALEYNGRIVAGVVYDPTREELFSAESGNGAYLNNSRISVSQTGELDKALLVTGFPYDIRKNKDNNIDNFKKFALCSQAVRRLGSAALDLCYTASGRFDGYWEYRLSPWDQAAGMLILQEAGGKITDFQGGQFSIYGDQVLATNGLIHKQMVHVLRH